MTRVADDSTPINEPAEDAATRLSTAQVAALIGYDPGTVRDAANVGEIAGSTKDARGRWWHEPEAVRRWATSRPYLRESADGWIRAPYWRGKGRTLTAEGFHPDAYPTDPDTGCWVWQAAVTTRGYPIAWDGNRHVTVRRVLWEQAHGPLPEGYRLRRRCTEVRCVNPDHVEPRPPGPTLRPVIPKPSTPPTRHQVRLGPLMPAERPVGMPEREWVLLTGLVAGRTLAEMAPVIGVTRQKCYVVLSRAEGRLRSGSG